MRLPLKKCFESKPFGNTTEVYERDMENHLLGKNVVFVSLIKK